ncbi:Serine/threonine-protein kinase mTOR [Exaiptasia diaphana]|nr:Serine/threonine-protein kinase mTOR [Exaiptasia diaphana]
MAQSLLTGLKSRSDEARLQAAKDLQYYVSTELREASAEQLTSFMDDFNHHIFEMVSSSDANEKKGGIMAIVGLLGISGGGNASKMTRFANYLRNLLPSNDTMVMEMASKAMGLLALTGGTFTADYVEFEVKRALEWLGGDRNEGRRHAAVLVLRELALNAPTFFFQQVQPFFDNIFNAVRDPKQAIREGAMEALKACLVILAQRETKEIRKPPLWYSQTYEEAKRGFEDTVNTKEKGVVLTKEDKAHGSLLIINELIRSAGPEGEHFKKDLEDIYSDQTQTSVSLNDLGITSPKSKFSQQTGILNQRTTLSSIVGSGLGEVSPMCHSKVCKEYMEVCGLVLRYKNIRSSCIQQTLLTLIPRLAAFQPQRFVKTYLHKDVIPYLIGALKRDRERSSAFKAVSLVAIAVKNNIEPHCKIILEQVKAFLPIKDLGHKRQKSVTVDPMVFACVAMMSRAVGPKISKDIKDLLEPMLSVGLSPALTACLHDLAHQVPQLKRSIQDGLLKMLSQILMHKSLRHPGAPKSSTPTLTQSASSHSLLDTIDSASTVLALRTLGTFDFDGLERNHAHLVRQCADTFLASEDKDTRMEAVRTCSRLLSPAIHNSEPFTPLLDLQCILGSVSREHRNPPCSVPTYPTMHCKYDPDIRYCVLIYLDERFDAHLAQAENLAALFVALSDEEFEIREIAIIIIGRLSRLNPAYIMPSLRKTLIQILTELQYSGVARNKEQSARMLGHLVSNAPMLIRPYMEPILKVGPFLILKWWKLAVN